MFLLWEHTKDFIAMQAGQYLERSSFSLDWKDDLKQAGYLALVDAATGYDPDRDAGFLTYLTYYLKSAFCDALGIRTTKQKSDPLHSAASLDRKINTDEGDADALEAMIGAPDPEIEEAEHRLYVEELRGALLSEVNRLPETESTVIKSYYFDEMTYSQISERDEVSIETVRRRKASGLRMLRRRARKSGLEKYLDERTPFYRGGGLSYFKKTHNSPVEVAVLKRESLRERM